MFGKLAIILYIFAVLVAIVGSAVNQSVGTKLFYDQYGNPTWTAESLETLSNMNEPDVSSNPTFIFGDFFTVASAVGTLIFQAASGGVVSDVFSGLTFSNNYVMMIIRFLYTFSGAMLIYHLLTGRGI